MIYKKYFEKLNKKEATFFDPGDIVGFKIFFPKKIGRIVCRSKQRPERYVVNIDGILHEIHCFDMYMKATTRMVFIEKWKDWRKA